jgi:hypothetical protein
MAQFKVFEKGMQVNGTSIMCVVSGLGSFKSLADKYLKNVGLVDIVADEQHWYPEDAWLQAYEQIAAELGDATLFNIGKKVPENSTFPEEVDSIEKGLASIDVAYHMNHKNAAGEVLFDPTRPASRIMLEGIGHYRSEKVEGENKIIMVCENPFPCAFDRGLIETIARKFKPLAKVVHDDSKPCRTKNAESCTFIVTWN